MITFNGYGFTWNPVDLNWTVSFSVKRTATIIGNDICIVEPYKGEYHTDFTNPKKMYTVKADNYPGVGKLDQMVKGSDLLEYIDSIRMGRGW